MMQLLPWLHAENGWLAARPSGTEDIYKFYAEAFLGRHVERVRGRALSSL